MEDDKPVPHRTLIVWCVICATVMQTLDSTIANVALPYMQGTFSSTLDQVTWVLTSYIVATAVFTGPVGWLSARYGRKTFFILCLSGFTISSVLCGFATSLSEMVFYRVLQGATGAAIVPLSQSIMMDLYPPQQRGSAMAMWGMGVMVGPIIGPTLGGYLIDAYDWRYVFFINLPFGIAAIAGLVLFLHDKPANKSMQFDWTGFATLAIGLGALQLMLDRGSDKDWFESGEIITAAVIAVTGFYLFVIHMWLSPKAFIPVALFRDRNFVVGIFTMFLVGAVLVASVALLAPYLQVLAGYSVWETGLLLAPRSIGVMASMMLAGRMTDKLDPRRLISAGVALLAFSFWEMSQWTPNIDSFTLVWVTMVQGAGLGFIFVPMQVLAFTTLSPALRTDGSAFLSLIRNVGSALGVSFIATMLARNAYIAHAQIAGSVTPFNRMLQSHGAYFLWNPVTSRGRAALDGEISRQALSISYSNDFLLMLWIVIPVLFLPFLMRKPVRHA
jgi:DHA2 family multidrug resistance protein